jgi:hypothetical protein
VFATLRCNFFNYHLAKHAYSLNFVQAELDRRGVKYSDLFEKSEFIQRLVQARGKDTANVDHSDSSESARKSPVDSVDHMPRADQASSTPEQAIRKEVEAMPLASIRSELAKLGVSTQGAFEKRVRVCSETIFVKLLSDGSQ